MRGYGAWCQGWRDAERLPPEPPGSPGPVFWIFIGLVILCCLQVAIQGHPFALILALAVLTGAIKGAS